ncbi:MAG TPA: hypothetical protein DCM13_07715 [Acidimicrobiaceae bacterium]|nr:hypothetical protein [Acidimicrobiaceae bacterium]
MSSPADRLQHHLLDHPDADPSRVLAELAPLLSRSERSDVLRQVTARRDGLGAIDVLRADPTVSEIMINGPGPVWVERNGALAPSDIRLDAVELDHLVERLVIPIGRRVDQRTPCVDGRLADGSRVHVAVPPVALDGPYVTIRRFVLLDVELGAFLPPDGVAVLDDAIRRHASIVVSGSTGSGKTTLLNAIAGRVDPGERLISVEDAAELRLVHPHVVRLETRPSSAEGTGEVPMRELVRNALRMRPDRLVLGEVRGGEAYDLMQALNTGHRGSLSTVHANSSSDALRRLELLALQGSDAIPLEVVRHQMAAAIDLIAHVERHGSARRRASRRVDRAAVGGEVSLLVPIVAFVGCVGVLGRPAPRSLVPVGAAPRPPALRWRRRRDDRAALPLALELLARELRAGATVPHAVRAVAADEACGRSLVSVVERIERGGRVIDELDRWAAASPSPDAHLARAVLQLGFTTGAALADSLDRVAATMRDRLEFDDELRALTAQSRASATVLTVAPAAFLLVLGLTAPELVAPLFTTRLGWICLLAGIGLDAVGFWWMRHLVAGVDR